ncbi:MAG: hypothetical protein Q9207_002909 [Kuettlingeria erythrocarpa]
MHLTRIYHTLLASLLLLKSVTAAADVEYIIYPVDALPAHLGSELDILIRSLTVRPEKVYASQRPNRPVPSYWGATLPETGFKLLKEHPWIEDIFPNEPLVKQFADYQVQHSAPEELRVISQPPGPEPIDRYHNYVYRTDSQRQIFLYHVELGINAHHVDFADRPVEWLYTRRAKFTGDDVETESPSTGYPGHSTCTASKAAGRFYGASRLSTLVVVKMPDLTPQSTDEVFSTITNHILENQRQGQSIVTVSWGSILPFRFTDSDPSSYWRRMRRDLRELADAGSHILFAAGNEARELDRQGRPRTDVDTAPAIFAAADFGLLKSLVVSNVDNGGKLWRTSQSSTRGIWAPWNVFAPGVQIKCASRDSNSGVIIDTGTSFSAPLAAGLIADAMATNQIIKTERIPLYVEIMEYARGWKRPGGESVMWNHVNEKHNPPSNPLVQGLFNGTLDAAAAVA